MKDYRLTTKCHGKLLLTYTDIHIRPVCHPLTLFHWKWNTRPSRNSEWSLEEMGLSKQEMRNSLQFYIRQITLLMDNRKVLLGQKKISQQSLPKISGCSAIIARKITNKLSDLESVFSQILPGKVYFVQITNFTCICIRMYVQYSVLHVYPLPCSGPGNALQKISTLWCS